MDAHPQIEAMPERDSLSDAIADLTGSTEALQRLSTLQGGDLARYRKAYWDRVRENWRAPSQGVFVDKMPLNTIWLCLIGKLFPDARILFALRDPRDVVLSSFRRRFGVLGCGRRCGILGCDRIRHSRHGARRDARSFGDAHS